MSIYKFMNSKVLFKDVRYRPYGSMEMPVMIHISECNMVTGPVIAHRCCSTSV